MVYSICISDTNRTPGPQISDLIVTDVYWTAGNLDADILRRFPNLTKLDCTLCNTSTLKGIEVCTKLEELACRGVGLTTLKGLGSCMNLRKFECMANCLKSLEGLEGCKQLTELNCSINELSSLKHLEACTKLTVLKCGYNKLKSLDGIPHIFLQKLGCAFNRLASVAEIDSCTSLEVLDCSGNGLDVINLEGCLRLQELDCSDNRLTIKSIRCSPLLKTLACSNSQGGNYKLESLDGLDRFTRLKRLSCSGNSLTTLAGIEGCSQLRHLICFENSLQTLAGIEACSLLRGLNCAHNHIKSLEQLVYMRYLTSVSVRGNPLDIQSPQVIRFLNRLDNANQHSSVYHDKQNVHDIHIQKTVCDSIQRLLTDPKPEFSIEGILESSLGEHIKQRLVEYCADETVHSQHLLTYAELLAYVWARINRSEHRAELMKILEEQITDAECMCFTGRFNRTLSVLVGFYPDIVISISDNSRISAIIIAARAMTPYDPEQHREVAHHRLIEAGYTLEQIQAWLDAIA